MPKNDDFNARFDAGEITWDDQELLVIAQPKVARTTSFPANVVCETAHSLAWNADGVVARTTRQRLAAEIAGVLNDRNDALAVLRLNSVDVLASR
jgi:hypothetical protein